MEANNREATEAEVKEGQIVESQKPKNEKVEDEKVRVKRGRVDSVSIYELSEGELSNIENGSRNSIFLNFAIFLISIAFSFLIAILTANFKDKQTVLIIFIVLTIVGFIGGAFLLILWIKMKDDFEETIKKIKRRMKE